MAQTSLPLVHHPEYDADSVGDDHAFPMRKYTALARQLMLDGLVAPGGFHIPEPVTRAELIRAHAPDYVDAVLTCQVDRHRSKRIGFDVTPAVVRRATLSAGGTLLTARLALQHGRAVNTAGGSHHADREGGAGYCVFNDVAVAALALLSAGDVARIAVIDADVHHGDGTARIFADDPRVFTLSIHCEQNWPIRKPPSDLDIPLPAGTGDGPYLRALSDGIDTVFTRFRPQLVFYNAGVDPHTNDRLGKLSLSDEGLRARDRLVAAKVRAAQTPMAGVLGGGYDRDIDALVRRHCSLVHAFNLPADANC
jgi:acetoin utilization deacetylase AcuC-like enzyme